VTIAIESGAPPMASRLFPTDNPVAAVIYQPALLLSILELRPPSDSDDSEDNFL